MVLNNEQTTLYRQTMDEAKAQLENLDSEIEDELKRTKAALMKLQQSKELFKQIYLSSAEILGIESPAVETGDSKEPAVSDTSLLKNLT